LKHGDETVIVLAPEVSWCAKGDLCQRVEVGATLDVLVLRYNYQKREIGGSIRRLHPEENPYRRLSRLEPGTVLRGKVKGVFPDGVTVALPCGARGEVPPSRHSRHDLKIGDEVAVTITALEVDEGRLVLAPVPDGTTPGDNALAPTLAGSP
jgi:ribosomal protein S1